MIKLCKNCANFRDNEHVGEPVCKKSSGKIDMVTGERMDLMFCRVMRSFDTLCGENAKFFESKTEAQNAAGN